MNKIKKSSVKNKVMPIINLPQLKFSESEQAMIDRYVAPHDKKSRDVTDADILRVAEEAKILYGLCFLPHGKYLGGEAMAHPQIDDKDPMKFFVTKTQDLIINPEIINHTNTLIEKPEGCMSFPEEPIINVNRWNKVTIRYKTLNSEGKLTDWIEENANGLRAQMFQHEIQHLGLLGDDHYIYKIKK